MVMGRNQGIDNAVVFLKLLRPKGPWLLSAIIPDGEIETRTLTTVDEVRNFVATHNGVRNLYYAINPTRTPLNKKASKTDIAAIEYLPSDLDPEVNETAEAAKARYLAKLNALSPQPAAIIDSGNGLNLLLKLAEPIVLDAPVAVSKRGKQYMEFPDATAKLIAKAENGAKLLMEQLGSVAGTQNIDRILRLPGTADRKEAARGPDPMPSQADQVQWSHLQPGRFPASDDDAQDDQVRAREWPNQDHALETVA
jgi:hypothetical protein